MSEVGTNALFQYDDIDGYRYVVFDFWKTIAYRVQICKSPNEATIHTSVLSLEPYFYHIDGSKSKSAFAAFSLDSTKKVAFITTQPKDVAIDLWRYFGERIAQIISTMVLSIRTLKEEVDLLSSKLRKYDEGQIDVARLLGFEENNVIAVIDIISQLHSNKDKYDVFKACYSSPRLGSLLTYNRKVYN